MESLNHRIRSFLGTHNVVTLSYCDNSRPKALALWYTSDIDLNLYFLSSLSTIHGKALRHGGDIAFTIQKDEQEWDKITGIQGTGRVEIIDMDLVWKNYGRKFPFVVKNFSDLQAAIEKSEMWKITPSWIRLIDNRVKLGHSEEMTLIPST